MGVVAELPDGRTSTTDVLTCCNDTYRRSPGGTWRYPWGEPVPGAVDLTLGDVLALELGDGVEELAVRPLTAAERAWLRGETADLDAVYVREPPPGHGRGVGDLVIGMLAPELHVLAMLTVGDVARLAGVSKATIDRYRSRGALPPPQAIRGRTPLWARPIVARWLSTRPGAGWRSDLYGAAVGQ
jgi:predicted DNA-binding transcriptional regulator AlpA